MLQLGILKLGCETASGKNKVHALISGNLVLIDRFLAVKEKMTQKLIPSVSISDLGIWRYYSICVVIGAIQIPNELKVLFTLAYAGH